MSGPGHGAVTCHRCGTPNVAGDQFCGNCGAPLEVASVGEATGARDVAPTAPAGTPSMAGAATSGSPKLVRCPTCGTANVAGRSFCQKCGGKLAGAVAATRLPLSGLGPPPAAGEDAPSGPARGGGPPPVATKGREAAPVQTRRRASPEEGRGGLSSWLVLVGAGVVVGAIVVAIVLGLSSGRAAPPAAASTAPSAPPAASPAASRSADPGEVGLR